MVKIVLTNDFPVLVDEEKWPIVATGETDTNIEDGDDFEAGIYVRHCEGADRCIVFGYYKSSETCIDVGDIIPWRGPAVVSAIREAARKLEQLTDDNKESEVILGALVADCIESLPGLEMPFVHVNV